jgi:hypothetical protein
LAKELGRTVAELEAGMSAKELIEWMAYARLEHDEAEQNAARQRAMAGATQARETARKF